jgi:nucleoside-diphosphate-sugar epimerase
MPKIVVFGGSGFVGSAVCKLLERYEAPRIDLTDNDAKWKIKKLVHDGDTIIMLAAITGEHGKAYHLTDLNVRMAASVLAGVEGKDIAHCVYVSSDSVYGNADRITEETAVLPSSLYGHMHALREQMFRERFDSLTILRPCAIYGVGDTHNAYGINQFIKSDTIELFGNGEECRSNIHVDDMAQIVVKAAVDKVKGTFNANCGVVYSFKEIAEMIGKPVVSKLRTMPIAHRNVDNSKLVKAFFAPRMAGEGIQQLLACMKD